MAKRGDVVLVLFPHSDLQSAKVRPALVVQADNLETSLPQVIVAMIFSRVFRIGHPSRVLLRKSTPAGKSAGLTRTSDVLTDNLATVAEQTIHRVIGRLPMAEVDAALRHTLNL